METKYSVVTTIATVCLVVLTAGVISTMDNNTDRNLRNGVIVLGCLLLFAAITVLRSSVRRA